MQGQRTSAGTAAVRNASHALYSVLNRLERANVHFSLIGYKDRAVSIRLVLRYDRAEVQVYEDGHVRVVRYKAAEVSVGDADPVRKLIVENAVLAPLPEQEGIRYATQRREL